MGKRVADQHAVMNEGWAVADQLAEALRETGVVAPSWRPPLEVERLARAALRRYEEARGG